MTKKLFLFAFVSTSAFFFSQVGINTSNPHPSSVLDLTSDTKGFLLPRLTTVAADNLSGTASEGLIVFDKDRKIFIGWDGTKWQNLGYEESNTVPNATNLNITGNYTVGSALTANYTFSDAESNPDDASTFIWKRADDASGTNVMNIASATAQNYTLVAADMNKYLQFCITPGSSVGASPGNLKCSAWGGPVGANQAPTASAVSISGNAVQGQTLTGNYTYNDAEANPQGTSTFRWTRSDDSSGTNETVISGASAKTYVVAAADVGKYIKFYVTPVASSGTTTGAEVGSAFKGPVITLLSGDVFNEGFESGVANGYFTVTTTSANATTGIVSSNSPSGWSPSSSPRAASGTKGYQFGAAGGTTGSTIFVSPTIDATQYTNNMTFSMKVAAFGTSSGSGMDSVSSDFVFVEVSSDGGTTYSAASLKQGGNNNANWAFSATGTATTAYGSTTYSQSAASSGDNLTAGPSTLTITGIPNTSTQLKFRITVRNSQTASNDENWVVDDIKLVAP
jgi:hypothetical protein